MFFSKMAFIVIVKLDRIEQDLFYMKNEPHSVATVKEYLRANGCTAEFIPLSGEYEKAKHKIASVFKAVKVHAPRATLPTKVLSMIEVLDKMLASYYIASSDLTLDHRRRVTRNQSVLTQAGATEESDIPSDPSQSDHEDPAEMADDHGRVRETRAGLDAAATNAPVMAMLSELMTKMVVQGRVLGEVQASVAGLHVKVDKLEKECKKHDVFLQQLVKEKVTGAWCSFCRSASHMLAECKSKVCCLICFTESHKLTNCPLRDLDCRECGSSTHSALVHGVKDPVLQELAKAKFGANFSFKK